MTPLQLTVQIEDVQTAFTRRRDHQAERGGVAVRQEGEGAGAAFHTGERRRDQHFQRFRTGRRIRRLVRILARLAAGSQRQQACA